LTTEDWIGKDLLLGGEIWHYVSVVTNEIENDSEYTRDEVWYALLQHFIYMSINLQMEYRTLHHEVDKANRTGDYLLDQGVYDHARAKHTHAETELAKMNYAKLNRRLAVLEGRIDCGEDINARQLQAEE